MNDNIITHDWDNVTTLHPLGIIAVVVLGITMLIVPRRYVIVPMIIMACFIPSVQRVVILGLDFNLLRILILFGWFRLLLRKELKGIVWKPIDLAFIAWVFVGLVTYSVLYKTTSAFVLRLGTSYDAIGMYFLFRILIRSWKDVERIFVIIAVISLPVAIWFLIEKTTGRNIFSIFGGVPEITDIRYGKLRAQGAFPHPIIAGSFWAVLIPLMAALWKDNTKRLLAVVGVIAALVIVVATASSTPLVAIGAAVIGLVGFTVRKKMRLVRWTCLLILVAVHAYMEITIGKPIWYLITKIDLLTGSANYHRYSLIDGAVTYFNEWWFIGTTSTEHWGWYTFDVTNQYILEGVRGGIWSLSLFVLVIVLAFQGIGRLRKVVEGDRYRLALVWGLGVSLFVHSVTFIGVSYFGQIYIIWFLTLAIIGSLIPVGSRRLAQGRSELARYQNYSPAAVVRTGKESIKWI